MRINHFNNFTNDTGDIRGYILLAYLVKNIAFCFCLERKFGEYFCEMPPEKRSKRRSSQEGERMSTQAQVRSPEVDELNCVPETQQSQQAVGWIRWWWEWRILWRCRIQNRVTLYLRHTRIRIQMMRTLLTHRLLGGHRRARAKARASRGPGMGNMYQKRRLRKEVRNRLFCSVLRRSRNEWTFYMTMKFSTTSFNGLQGWVKEGGCVG